MVGGRRRGWCVGGGGGGGLGCIQMSSWNRSINITCWGGPGRKLLSGNARVPAGDRWTVTYAAGE